MMTSRGNLSECIVIHMQLIVISDEYSNYVSIH